MLSNLSSLPLVCVIVYKEDRAVLVKGCKDLQRKDDKVVDSPSDVKHEQFIDTEDSEQAEKEISSLCWVTSDGSILAVGYVDGDILLWNLSIAASSKDQQGQKASNNVIKLQLSSSDRRLPVIVLHCSGNKSHTDCEGQLFVYGGDEIGSEEVLTSQGYICSIADIDHNKVVRGMRRSAASTWVRHNHFDEARASRASCALRASCDSYICSSRNSDLIVVAVARMPNGSATERSDISSLFVLSNPGQLHFYDDSCLAALMSHPEKKYSVPAIPYPGVIPTVEPYMTVGKLKLVQTEGSFSRALSETVSKAKDTTMSSKWPLTGGVPSPLSFAEDNGIKRVYIGGYQDGSVRIWDATFPVLSGILVLGSEVEGIEVAGTNASVSALDFLSSTSSLAIGNECGLVIFFSFVCFDLGCACAHARVRLYRLIGNSDEMSLHYITETKREVHNLHGESGAQCIAIFSILNSPVAMLDISSLSVLFFTDSLVSSSSPVISLAMQTFPTPSILDHSENRNEAEKEVIFILTIDAHVVVIDSTMGNMISSLTMEEHSTELTAISLYILGKCNNLRSMILKQKTEPSQTNAHNECDSSETKSDTSAQAAYLGQSFMDSLVLLCCEDALHLYSLKSLIKGENKSICKVNLEKPCCWTTIFKKNGKACGLILVYQTGLIEIRSLPSLEMVGESSLMSIVRWNFKTSMSKTICSSDKGQIVLVNGCEVAFISLFAFENEFRIPEALPCLHDKVLEAAEDATVRLSQSQKKQGISAGILGGIIKGFKRDKTENSGVLIDGHKTIVEHLEGIFSRFPFSDLSTIIPDDLEFGLGIDDIDIDEPAPVTSSPPQKSKTERKDKEAEREKLFEGGSTDTKPRMRTAEEIRAKYRKDGDASSAASQARDKLVERQEKLEKLSRRTEELQSGAQNFADMASELAKTMEKRKWWNL
ncbi:transducin family protein [Actinidia rufa]|uniref:Transducin family protein n=1 Tax=Actinidia rufa TaxID=165716 RepID=A0A7J0GWU5_9ERIC|nr:transducin family protein [Actinidia rufa]